MIGGRISFALLHSSYYGTDPGVLLDPAVGGLELGLARRRGTLSGAYVASLLEAPVGQWFHLAAELPALLAIGAGKPGDDPHRRRPGPAHGRRLVGDGLRRTRSVGLARAGHPVAPVAGVRGSRR